MIAYKVVKPPYQPGGGEYKSACAGWYSEVWWKGNWAAIESGWDYFPVTRIYNICEPTLFPKSPGAAFSELEDAQEFAKWHNKNTKYSYNRLRVFKAEVETIPTPDCIYLGNIPAGTIFCKSITILEEIK